MKDTDEKAVLKARDKQNLVSPAPLSLCVHVQDDHTIFFVGEGN